MNSTGEDSVDSELHCLRHLPGDQWAWAEIADGRLIRGIEQVRRPGTLASPALVEELGRMPMGAKGVKDVIPGAVNLYKTAQGGVAMTQITTFPLDIETVVYRLNLRRQFISHGRLAFPIKEAEIEHTAVDMEDLKHMWILISQVMVQVIEIVREIICPQIPIGVVLIMINHTKAHQDAEVEVLYIENGQTGDRTAGEAIVPRWLRSCDLWRSENIAYRRLKNTTQELRNPAFR
ncbi:hypothetical protein BJX61DRAFT_546591 [Aspergillus egyptiacus]|nr:hypothetical protein BJX61DRAFT_546591 [Aspergillus egyptiacus]